MTRGRHASPTRLIRRPWAVAAALIGITMVCGAVTGLAWAGHTGRAATPVGKPPLVPVPKGKWAAAAQALSAAVPKPTALDIPAIGVQTSLVRLGLTPAGTLQVPASTAVAGWYTDSPRPGAIGAAVIAGHVDSYLGPGVFFRLRDLRPGNLIYVRRYHGSLAVFRVTAVRTFLKKEFPAADVYGPVPDAQLRLITCGGTFDPSNGHYLSNVIVFAVLASA
ncbi:MAG TPA: class F sortase [Streptosporangiaceae bacterium]|nr:class F sortase [Streptosporangiaceae bacterium]